MTERRKRNPWLSVGVLVFSALAATFNETSLNVALLPVAEDMNVGTAAVQWLITGYMLVTAVHGTRHRIPLSEYSDEKAVYRRYADHSCRYSGLLSFSQLSGASRFPYDTGRRNRYDDSDHDEHRSARRAEGKDRNSHGTVRLRHHARTRLRSEYLRHSRPVFQLESDFHSHHDSGCRRDSPRHRRPDHRTFFLRRTDRSPQRPERSEKTLP